MIPREWKQLESIGRTRRAAPNDASLKQWSIGRVIELAPDALSFCCGASFHAKPVPTFAPDALGSHPVPIRDGFADVPGQLLHHVIAAVARQVEIDHEGR